MRINNINLLKVQTSGGINSSFEESFNALIKEVSTNTDKTDKKKENNSTSDDLNLDQVFKKSLSMMFYSYSQQGLWGVFVTSLIWITKYILRQTYTTSLIPDLNPLYNLKKSKIDIREKIFDIYFHDIVKDMAPILMEEYMLNENLRVIEEYEDFNITKVRQQQIESEYKKAKKLQQQIRKEISQKSIKELEAWFEKNEFSWIDWVKFLKKNWTNKQERSAYYFLKGREHKKFIKHPFLQKRIELPSEDGLPYTSKSYMVRTSFMDILKKFSNNLNKIKDMKNLSNTEKNKIKFTSFFVNNIYTDIHPTIETAFSSIDAFYSGASPVSNIYSIAAPLVTQKIFAFENLGTNYNREKQEKIKILTKFIKNLGSTLKRLDGFNLAELINIYILSDFKKRSRDFLEDNTSMKYWLLGRRKDIERKRDSKNLFFMPRYSYSLKKGEELNWKENVAIGAIKVMPFKFMAEIFSYTTGMVIISLCVKYFKKYFGKYFNFNKKQEKEEDKINISNPKQNFFS